MTRYREGYEYGIPFMDTEYSSREDVCGAFFASTEYLIGLNLKTITTERKDNEFAGFSFTSQQLNIVNDVCYRDLLSRNAYHNPLPQLDIYAEANNLTYLNNAPKIPSTTRLPINRIRLISEPRLSLDISPLQRPEDLDFLALPFIHSLVTSIEISSWGPGRKPLSGELRQQASHVITKPDFFSKNAVLYAANSGIFLNPDSYSRLETEIQKLTSYKGTRSTLPGKASRTTNQHGADWQSTGDPNAEDYNGTW